MTNNILTFPKEKIVREAINDSEELKKAQEKSLKNYADSVVDELASSIVGEIDNYGLEREDEKTKRDLNFSLMIMAAMVYRSLKIHHELHPFLDEYVKTMEVLMKEMKDEDIDIS